MALARVNLGGAFVNADADGFRSGEGDEANARIVGHQVADFAAASRHEVDDARRHAGFLHDFVHLVGEDRGVAGRLQEHAVADHHRRHRHADEDGEREVPGGNRYADADRLVEVLVRFIVEVTELGRVRQLERVTAIPLEEVDRFRDFAIGFSPALVQLVGHPRGVLEAATANDRGHLEEHGRAGLHGELLPALHGFPGRNDRVLDVRRTSHGDLADHLIQVARIDRGDPFAGFAPLAVHDDRIILAEFGLDLRQRLEHFCSVGFLRKIDERLGRVMSSHCNVPLALWARTPETYSLAAIVSDEPSVNQITGHKESRFTEKRAGISHPGPRFVWINRRTT